MDLVYYKNLFLNCIVSNNIVQLLLELRNEFTLCELERKIGISRRSINRYCSRERDVPISAIKKIAHFIEIDEMILFKTMKDENQTYCNCLIPIETNNKIIWFENESNILVNTLYLFRKAILEKTFFEMAYFLEIEPHILSQYESGKKAIPSFEVQNIITKLQITIDILYPQLQSFDLGKTFLPTHYYSFTYKDKEYDLLDYYICENNEPINLFQEWPINRYNENGKIIMNVMPDELTMDETYGIDDLWFYDSENKTHYTTKNFPEESLPPNYYIYQKLFREQYKPTNQELLVYKGNLFVLRIEVVDNWKIQVKYQNGHKGIYNFSAYINSGSVIYQQLADLEYFKKVKLQKLNNKDSKTQIFIWPNGQCIRLDELKLINNHPGKYYPSKGVSYVNNIGNWIHYYKQTK